MASRERDDEIAINTGRAFRQDGKAAVRHAGDGGDRALNVGGIIFDAARDQLDSKQPGPSLGHAQPIVIEGRCFWISQNSHTYSLWRDPLEDFQPFANDA